MPPSQTAVAKKAATHAAKAVSNGASVSSAVSSAVAVAIPKTYAPVVNPKQRATPTAPIKNPVAPRSKPIKNPS